MRRTQRLRFVAIGIALVLLAGCAPTSGVVDEEPAGLGESLKPGAPESIVTDLVMPWSTVFIDGSGLVSERDSRRILEVEASGATREVAVLPGIGRSRDSTILGLALLDRELYVFRTSPAGNRIDRFELLGEASSFRLGARERVLSGLPDAILRAHNGGRMAFGPDGMLYVTVGDGLEPSAAQDPSSYAGKILRMTPDGDVPADNPFPGSLVYSLGHRNPLGIAWGPDGTMYESELGEATWDELNIIVAGGNYGWPTVEGAAGRPGFVDPVQQWHPSEASPSGIAIVGDSLWIGNLRGQRIRIVPLSDPTSSRQFAMGTFGRVRDITRAPDGSVWVLTSNLDRQIEPRPGDDRIVRIPVSP